MSPKNVSGFPGSNSSVSFSRVLWLVPCESCIVGPKSVDDAFYILNSWLQRRKLVSQEHQQFRVISRIFCGFRYIYKLAEPAPGFAWKNSTNHSLSSSTTYFTLSMSLDLTTHLALTIFVVTFGTGWSGHSPPLPSLWQWWQQAISWRVKPQLGLPGSSSHRLSSYTQMSSVTEPSIGSLIGSLEAEWQLE